MQSVPDFHSYGRKTLKTEGVQHVIKAQNLSGFAEKTNNVLEGKYASAVREPLGFGYQRGYMWPEKTQTGCMSFGKPTKDSLHAKELIYAAGGSKEEKNEVKRMYIKTHGNYAPGEQKTRDYEWVNNPRVGAGDGETLHHAFGYGEEKLLNGAQKAVMPERAHESFPKTVIVKKTVEDAKAV